MDSSKPWVVFPATDVPSAIGFILMTVVAIAIAKRIPFVKNVL